MESTGSALPTPGEETLRGLLEAVVEGFGLEAAVTVAHEEGAGWSGSIDGEDADAVVGRNGEVIDAVQYLAAQAMGKGDGPRQRVSVNAAGYRERREALLIDLAGRAAKEALEFGEEIEFDAMTPHDRRIVHMALKDRTDVVTRSEGEEPRRRIVVEPAD